MAHQQPGQAARPEVHADAVGLQRRRRTIRIQAQPCRAAPPWAWKRRIADSISRQPNSTRSRLSSDARSTSSGCRRARRARSWRRSRRTRARSPRATRPSPERTARQGRSVSAGAGRPPPPTGSPPRPRAPRRSTRRDEAVHRGLRPSGRSRPAGVPRGSGRGRWRRVRQPHALQLLVEPRVGRLADRLPSDLGQLGFGRRVRRRVPPATAVDARAAPRAPSR